MSKALSKHEVFPVEKDRKSFLVDRFYLSKKDKILGFFGFFLGSPRERPQALGYHSNTHDARAIAMPCFSPALLPPLKHYSKTNLILLPYHTLLTTTFIRSFPKGASLRSLKSTSFKTFNSRVVSHAPLNTKPNTITLSTTSIISTTFSTHA